MLKAFYNEIDRFCCDWLQNLMDSGHITPGKIDDRSITELTAADVRGYERVHFFAGIAGWDLAANLAGWGDRPLWTGSCPCQPFSAAGKQRGHEDERHLWPAFFRLIRECRPPTVVGEQVDAAIAAGWLDSVFDDLEGEGYACAAADLPACGVGAPHKRQRLFWVARQVPASVYRGEDGVIYCERCHMEPLGGECACPHGEMQCLECGEWTYPFFYNVPDDGCQWCGSSSLVDPMCERGRSRESGWDDATDVLATSPWVDCCIEPIYGGGLLVAPRVDLPLAHGVPGRVGRLRAYGNAIVPQVAAEFLAAVMECRP